MRSPNQDATRATPWRNRIVGQGEEDPTQLLANPLNWRIHGGAQRDALRGSLRAVGWVQQVIVNRTTGHVVDGHARIEEAISAGAPTVPVLYVELSEAEEKLVLATLDPIGAMAERDDQLLAELLAGIDVEDEGLQALLDSLAITEPKVGLTDPDEAPALPDEPWVKEGDLFALGDHRLLCGDASSADNVARLMAGDLAELVWTDPPYGVGYVGGTRDALTIENDDAVSGPAIFAAAASVALLAPAAAFYVAVPAGPLQLAFLLAVRDVGWRLHEELVWVKSSMVLGHSDYHYRHEPILYGYTPGSGRPGRGKHAGSHWYGDNSQTSVLEFDKPSRSPEHPTMKPVGLVEQCLANSSRPGDIVYDPFAGSGTTVIAAEQLGRQARVIEIDPCYAQVVVQRWQDFTGQAAERIDG